MGPRTCRRDPETGLHSGKRRPLPAKFPRTAHNTGDLKMNAKQQCFVREYLVDFNATAAAKRAGYSPRTADRSGLRLLGNVGIQAALQDAIEARAKRAELDADFVLDFLRDIMEAADTPMATRVRSAELVGKHLGMFTEKVAVTTTPPPPMRLVIVDTLDPGFDPTHGRLCAKCGAPAVDCESDASEPEPVPQPDS